MINRKNSVTTSLIEMKCEKIINDLMICKQTKMEENIMVNFGLVFQKEYVYMYVNNVHKCMYLLIDKNKSREK